MADILEQLLGVEKKAAQLVAEAEAEAARRKSAARLAASQEQAAAQRERVAAVEAEVSEARTKATAEREERGRAYREKLERHPVERARFEAAVRRFLQPRS